MKCVPILENFLNLVENLDSRMKAETAKEDVYLRMKLYLANQLIQELNGTELTMAIHVNNDNMVSFVFHWIGSKKVFFANKEEIKELLGKFNKSMIKLDSELIDIKLSGNRRLKFFVEV